VLCTNICLFLEICLCLMSAINLCKLQGGPKNVPLYFCQYLHQKSTDFQNFFTSAFCGQLAIK